VWGRKNRAELHFVYQAIRAGFTFARKSAAEIRCGRFGKTPASNRVKDAFTAIPAPVAVAFIDATSASRRRLRLR
jgi:hypothetical protein